MVVLWGLCFLLIPIALAAEQAGGEEKAAKSESSAQGTAAQPAQTAAEAGKEAGKKPEKPAPPQKEAQKGTEKERPAPKEKPAPSTVTVKREKLEIKLTLDGSFLARSTAEVAVRPKQWSNFKVLEAVPHGTTVNRGDVLVRFDTEGIDRAIADQRAALKLADLALKQAEEDLRLLEAATPLDLELAARSAKRANEDLERFLKVDLPMSRKSAEQSLQNARDYLDYEKEELRQLEKMYKADDLTEETEEIVLRRQRDAVRRAEFSLEQAKHYYEETLTVRLPRLEESLREALQRAKLSRQRAEVTLPVALNRQRLELEKMKVQRERDRKKLEELEADRQQMIVKSPMDGVVYYGRWSMGKWSGASSSASDLRPGARVSANEVLMTVVKPRPLVLRVTVPEKELHWLRSGLEAKVRPTGYPGRTLSGRVKRVSPVPVASGSFAAELTVGVPEDGPPLMPGMAAKVELVPYLRPKALTVPLSALSTDQLDARRIFVQVVGPKGKARERRVEVGQKSGDRVEILNGLSEGEKVLKEYPKQAD